MGVGTPQGGRVRPGHKGLRRKALQEPWGPPARPHQLQPQPQLCHLLLLLTKTVALQDTVQVLMGQRGCAKGGVQGCSEAEVQETEEHT